MSLPNQKDLGQWFTPAWAAERLVELYFGDLGAGDFVIEPTCGAGAFLSVIPPETRALGIEIDPELAAIAERVSGRQVIVGDVRHVRLQEKPTAVIGNPPFKVALVEDILAMSHQWLPDGGIVGLVLPTYFFQTASRVLRYSQQWRVQADHIPRDLFPRITKPLVFATFRRGGRTLVGFTLYEEFEDVRRLAECFRDALRDAARSPWRRVVAEALHALGGTASLSELYQTIEPRRPTSNQWWKEKVRQVAQLYFHRAGPARYSLMEAA